MASSLPFTATFSSPSHKYIAEKPSFYSLRQQQSFRSSKSGFLRHGFSLQSQNSVAFVRKTPSFRVFARAATENGLTSSNYSELSHVYEKYKTQGFEILAFPCNQFGGQEPGSNPEIKQFACTRFKAEFPIFDKVDVNGPSTAPVYQFLKSSAGGFLGDLIKWNFEKFLVDKNGKVVERYAPTTSPFQIEKDIQKLLAA
ncbi:Putative glutathione peroxidase 7, chloroplastic [Linum perenne]